MYNLTRLRSLCSVQVSCHSRINLKAVGVHVAACLQEGVGAKLHKPSTFDKRMLVLTGRFKNIEEIPNSVSIDTMAKTHSKMRIYIANLMMIATLIGCYVMVKSGKNAAKRGESVVKENIAWHEEERLKAAGSKE